MVGPGTQLTADNASLCYRDNIHRSKRSTDQENGSVIRMKRNFAPRTQTHGISDNKIVAFIVDIVVELNESGLGEVPGAKQPVARCARRSDVLRANRGVLFRAQHITRGEGAFIACSVGGNTTQSARCS